MGLSKHKVVGVILSRVGSKRLPEKALLHLAGQPMIQRYIQRCKLIEGIDELVLATTKKPEDNVLCDIAETEGIEYFRGSEDDVLNRIIQCTDKFEGDLVVRLCADNPLIEPEEVDTLINSYCHCEYMYTNAGDYANTIDGLGAEMYHINGLKWINSITNSFSDPKFREHPHKMFAEMGHVVTVDLKENYPKVKLDINEQIDYERISNIYDKYGAMPLIKDYKGEFQGGFKWHSQVKQTYGCLLERQHRIIPIKHQRQGH